MKPLLIVVGNPMRGDDGLALSLLDEVQSQYFERADYSTLTGDPLDLLDIWEHRQKVILIDALKVDQGPVGDFQEWSLTGGHLDSLPAFLTGGFSSHMFGLSETLKLAESLGRLPRELTLIGIYANDFKLGMDKSQLNPEALKKLSKRIGVLLQNI